MQKYLLGVEVAGGWCGNPIAQKTPFRSHPSTLQRGTGLQVSRVDVLKKEKKSVNCCISQLLFRKIFVVLENPELLSFLFEEEFVFLKFDKL